MGGQKLEIVCLKHTGAKGAKGMGQWLARKRGREITSFYAEEKALVEGDKLMT